MRRSSAHSRGFTLVELMVVVVILAILAGLAIASFSTTVDKGKITSMKRYAKDVEKGQHQYNSRNNRYLNPGTTIYAAGNVQWEELLEFQPDNPHPSTRIMTAAGTPNENCGICPGNVTPDTTENWYAIKVCRDLDGSGVGNGTECGDETIVYLDNDREDPLVLQEGQ